MKKLFGTDGIRGPAGEFPLEKNTVSIIGTSLARQYRESLGREPRFLTGRDTRESGEWIEAAFHAGASSENAVSESAGVTTTPGVAYLTKAFDFDAGIVISASHNSYEDNGIKIFAPSGKKIGCETELRIEKDVFSSDAEPPNAVSVEEGRSSQFRGKYLEHLSREANGFSARNRKIVIDCANGAASRLAPQLFAGLGAQIIVINAQPDGRNINHNCGSLHLKELQSRVLKEGADLGIAFDGDADRALFVDENGNEVDGDATLWIMANFLKAHGNLPHSTVIATVMSNIGLEKALDAIGVKLIRTDVGDKHVLEKLIETGAAIGGEQSGHIIFPQISLVGDGMMTASLLLRSICERGVSLSEACDGFVRFPQILRNVEVREKKPFGEIPEIAAVAKAVENELHGEGRLLLRYSGTENLARVMIEGRDQSGIENQAERLIETIGKTLG